MSLYAMMRTGISGMNAQASRLGTVADNIANADTTGYKRVSTEFSTLVLNSGVVGRYQSGGVNIDTRSLAAEQGALRYTSSATDLAIAGSGHFVVSNGEGASFLTRAGAFRPNGEGFLVNSDGFRLMGHPISGGGNAAIVNGFDGLEPIDISNRTLQANATTSGTLNANLPSQGDIIAAANLPSANGAAAEYNAKASLVTYDAMGGEVVLDIYFAQSAVGTWEVTVYDRADAAAAGGFPYAAAPLSGTSLAFDSATGQLTAASATDISVAIPGGETMTLDMADMTQFASEYAVLQANVDGNAPSAIENVSVTRDGLVVGVFRNGATAPIAQLAIADVPNQSGLERVSGNLFALTQEAGAVRIGTPDTSGFGSIFGGALEQSTVDMGTELTEMIQSQRTYTANSKVFMTGSELMDVLVNLKR